MILGFAHITKNVGRQVGGPSMPNPPEKWPLMALEAASYRVELRDRDGWVREECILYDAGLVSLRGRLGVEDGAPIIVVRDRLGEELFLREGLGFQVASNDEGGESLLRLGSQVAKWQVEVTLRQDDHAAIDPPLDIAGYAALAFYSSDVGADCEHLFKHGSRTPTERFVAEVGGKSFEIVMLRSPEGTIIELIQVKGKA